MLHNLLDNAIRHTPAAARSWSSVGVDRRGRPRIVGRATSAAASPSRDLDRVFDVAFRGDAARSTDERGGGLGLAIAKGLVEAHDGTIDVGNEGPGCRFVVRLPRDL